MKKLARMLLVLLLFLSFDIVVSAGSIGGDNGGRPSQGSTGSGGWYSNTIGLKVTILDDSGNLKVSKIVGNGSWPDAGDFIGKYYSSTEIGTVGGISSHLPKYKESDSFHEVVGDSSYWGNTRIKMYRNTKLPSGWQKSGEIIVLNNILSANDYDVLKDILSMKDSSGKNIFGTLVDSDYITIEPMTCIQYRCGTLYELAKIDNDVPSSAKKDDDTNWSWKSWYSRVLVGMSKSLYYNGSRFYIGSDAYIDKGDINSSKDNAYKCLKKNTCGLGIGVYKYSDIVDKGYLVIKKVNESNAPITGSRATFGIYTDSSCKTFHSEVKTNAGSGITDKISLAVGTYYIKETQAPTNYKINNTCTRVDITKSNTAAAAKTVTIKNTYNGSTCINDFQNTVSKRISLFKNSYSKYNNLLNFSLSDASAACTTATLTPKYSIDCLTGETTQGGYASFSSNNLSGHSIFMTDASNNSTFCTVSIKFDRVASTTPSSINAGQLFLNSPSGVATRATFKAKCYRVSASGQLIYTKVKLGKYSNFVSNVKLNGEDLNFEDFDIVVTPGVEYVANVDYKFNPIYVKNGSGEKSSTDCSECKFLGYGYLSQLNDSGTKNISFTYTTSITGSNESAISKTGYCTYKAIPEVVKNDDLDIEIRNVKTDNPFPGKSGEQRTPGSNWKIDTLDTNGDGVIDLIDYNYVYDLRDYQDRYDINRNGTIDSGDLAVIFKYINDSGDTYAQTLLENSPNSYGIIPKTGVTVSPKYVITLNSNSISKIRKYISDNGIKYDDYSLTCKLDGEICISPYLTSLVNDGVLKIYNSRKRELYNRS